MHSKICTVLVILLTAAVCLAVPALAVIPVVDDKTGEYPPGWNTGFNYNYYKDSTDPTPCPAGPVPQMITDGIFYSVSYTQKDGKITVTDTVYPGESHTILEYPADGVEPPENGMFVREWTAVMDDGTNITYSVNETVYVENNMTLYPVWTNSTNGTVRLPDTAKTTPVPFVAGIAGIIAAAALLRRRN